MEADEENNGNSLKRQRAPLSDSEDNKSSSEVNDGQKRRRLEASGRENRIPKPSSSGRLAELETKPDTPIVPSVRSRVQQLTQRRDGGSPLAQRCLSDPGADGSSVFHEMSCRQHLLGEREFHQRLERFKVPVFQGTPSPTPSPTKSSPRTRSNVVSDIQQKLQCTTTPSSQQASRMREERKQELSRLQPISENAWLKRSSSDPMLSQADGDAEMKDGSFTEVLTSGAGKQSSDARGGKTPHNSETPAASAELDASNDGQLQMEWKEQKCEEVREKEHKASVGIEGKQLMHKQLQTQTVLTLSFSEDQSFSREPYSEDPNMSELLTGDEKSFLESTHQEESSAKETPTVSKVTGRGSSEVFSFEEGDETHSRSYSEEEIEPSTDEELRLWRYPQDQVYKEEESLAADDREEGNLESSRKEKEEGGSVTGGCEPSDIKDGECHSGSVSVETAGSSEMQEGEKPVPGEEGVESQSCLDVSVRDQSTSSRHQACVDSFKGCYVEASSEDVDIYTSKQDHKVTGGRHHEDDAHQQTTGTLRETIIKTELDRKGPRSAVDQTDSSPFSEALNQTQTKNSELATDTKGGAKPQVEIHVESSDIDGNVGARCMTEADAVDEGQTVAHEPTETCKAEGGESSKKVSFILEPELINDSVQSEINTSTESRDETNVSDAEQSCHDETNTAEIIDQMFEEVLDYAGRMEQERADNGDTGGRDGACSGDKDEMDAESEKERSEEGEAKEEECDESNGDELLTFPSSGILSPLSKSVEAVVTPLRLTASQESNPPSLLLTPEETSNPPAESAPLYSVDAYRTQRQSKKSAIQNVTPAVQRQAPHQTRPQPSVNIKERIASLNAEAARLQSVINQTLQALSCCTDEEHGRGSMEEAEAEKLLLVSCEKHSALLAEVTRVREERNSESGEAEGAQVSQQPCRGTVSISNIQLPLKVEFVCSSHNRAGRPSHYFFILIRYGPCNIFATPLATAADAQNGDTISFPTSVTLKDIRSSFEIDVEVYSLSHTSGGNCSMDRTMTKSRVTPRKLLNTITQKTSHSLTSATLPALTRRSSNFCLVGSHKITLASLGHSKFPLDKMKLEVKIRRLLGDEFQEKVPFLSPLEGNIYLRLDSQSHSNVQHQGFLTMFELISGYGVWHRRFFVLEGCVMYYWNHPNDKETKEAEGSISLSTSTSQCVRPVNRDSCARPFTFELVNNTPQQQDDAQEALAKCWFSADTKQERLDWMEKLNQALLDFHTWKGASATQTESQQSNTSSSGNLRESIL